MYEIDLSTLLLIGIDEKTTKVVDFNGEYIIKECSKNIVNYSCKFFGSSLIERGNITKRLINVSNKAPIFIEETKNMIFFPLRSTREKVNVWISFNNLESYQQDGCKTLLKFKNQHELLVDFSYYMVDNQMTRCMMLDYMAKKRRESL